MKDRTVKESALRATERKLMTLLQSQVGASVSTGGGIQMLKSGTDINNVVKPGTYGINNYGTIIPFFVKGPGRLVATALGPNSPDVLWVLKNGDEVTSYNTHSIDVSILENTSVYIFNIDTLEVGAGLVIGEDTTAGLIDFVDLPSCNILVFDKTRCTVKGSSDYFGNNLQTLSLNSPTNEVPFSEVDDHTNDLINIERLNISCNTAGTTSYNIIKGDVTILDKLEELILKKVDLDNDLNDWVLPKICELNGCPNLSADIGTWSWETSESTRLTVHNIPDVKGVLKTGLEYPESIIFRYCGFSKLDIERNIMVLADNLTSTVESGTIEFSGMGTITNVEALAAVSQLRTRGYTVVIDGLD